MASFIHAFRKTMEHEGGYSNNPTDAGGETYRGISRVYNPNCDIWPHIDNYKSMNKDINSKAVFEFLDPKVQYFYRTIYWDRMLLDHMRSQEIAEAMFDIGVNLGIGRAVTFLQRSLNVMNRGERLYPNLVVDGRIGQKTLHAANDVRFSLEDIHAILVWMHVQQGAHYMDYMARSPLQEEFARGWAKRVQLGKR